MNEVQLPGAFANFTTDDQGSMSWLVPCDAQDVVKTNSHPR